MAGFVDLSPAFVSDRRNALFHEGVLIAANEDHLFRLLVGADAKAQGARQASLADKQTNWNVRAIGDDVSRRPQRDVLVHIDVPTIDDFGTVG